MTEIVSLYENNAGRLYACVRIDDFCLSYDVTCRQDKGRWLDDAIDILDGNVDFEEVPEAEWEIAEVRETNLLSTVDRKDWGVASTIYANAGRAGFRYIWGRKVEW